MEIEIVGWDNYNPRKNYKSTSWLRLSNTLLEDPDFYSFNNGEMLAWIYLLSIASKKYSGTIQVNYEHAERVSRIKERDLKNAIKKLEELQLVRAHVTDTTRARHAHDTQTCSTRVATNERTNEHNEQTNEGCSERFERSGTAIAEFKVLETVLVEREVGEGLQRQWLETFPDAAWVISEIRKALLWETANPVRRKKRFGAFVTRWLTKGWDQRQTTPGMSPRKSIAEILGEEAV
jgi:hypothetical protein